MTELKIEAARQQSALPDEPYDRWITTEGQVKAEFHRADGGFLVRFPGDADFQIAERGSHVVAIPAEEGGAEAVYDIYRNAILPVIANHTGGLCLHGSAIVYEGAALAFIGQSRSGKTTLAATLAKAGYPFLTEDVVEITSDDDGLLVQPKEPTLRLMGDSFNFVFGRCLVGLNDDRKRAIDIADSMPVSATAVPLAALLLLSDTDPAEVQISRLGASQALAQLLQHSFILDVEDKRRLEDHFTRLAELSRTIACYSLDYRRDYSELNRVIAAIRKLDLKAN